MTVVEWLGGPEDGATFKVRSDVRHITIERCIHPRLDFSPEADYPGQPLEHTIETMTIPITIRNGKAYAIYPKEEAHDEPESD